MLQRAGISEVAIVKLDLIEDVFDASGSECAIATHNAVHFIAFF